MVSNPHLSAIKRPFVREQPQLGDLLTMVINHLLNGMILQAVVPHIPTRARGADDDLSTVGTGPHEKSTF